MKLHNRLTKIKEHYKDIELKNLNKKIYNLNLSKKYLEQLSKGYLQYIHVKLHNALAYKKPFAKIEDIKKVHDIIAKLLEKHVKTDELDE